jgi:hypothetical protein
MSKKQTNFDPNGTYHYRGDGLCIPGLPHEVTLRQAKELGLLKVLQDAIENGVYSPTPAPPPSPTPTPSPFASTANGEGKPPAEETAAEGE